MNTARLLEKLNPAIKSYNLLDANGSPRALCASLSDMKRGNMVVRELPLDMDEAAAAKVAKEMLSELKKRAAATKARRAVDPDKLG